MSAVQKLALCKRDVQFRAVDRPATLIANLLVECLVIFRQELLTAVSLVGCDAV